MAKKAENSDLDDLIYGIPGRLEHLWDQIKTPLFWSFAAFFSLGLLVSLSVTKKGGERLTQIPYDMQDIIEKRQQGASLSAALDRRIGPLHEESRQLVAERAKLETRIAQIEENLGDITASIPKTAKAPATAKTAVSPADDKDVAAFQKKSALANETGLSGAGGLTLATRSQFGIDLGAEQTLQGTRTRWVKLMEQYGPLMSGYEPVITVQDSGKTISLHLVVGPFSNVTEAAEACAKLRSAGYSTCTPAPYDGQRLALQ